jgi:hypothetical protein
VPPLETTIMLPNRNLFHPLKVRPGGERPLEGPCWPGPDLTLCRKLARRD